jgi:glycosyltransferase involved in cell wall biosynthesis/LmbE family N-acetylglucosaminyl deacetylase
MKENNYIPHNPSSLPDGPYLVFAPHPEDATLGMGGTIRLARQQHIQVDVVFLTDGREHDNPETCSIECECSMKSLDVNYYEFWHYQYENFVQAQGVSNHLERILIQTTPRTIFLPSPQEYHMDQRAALSLLWPLLHDLGYRGFLWTYEISRHAEANILIDITSVIEEKKRAIRCYECQLRFVDFGETTIALNRARSVTQPKECLYSEAFYNYPRWWSTDPKKYTINTIQSYFHHFNENYNKPLVSVIIRTKDRENLLKEALDSLSNQWYKNIEAIIINDGGADVSHITEKYGNIFQYIHCINLRTNVGRPAALNYGIRKSKGEWICFLDDDDVYYKNFIETLLYNVLKTNYKIVYGQVKVCNYDLNNEKNNGKYSVYYAQPFDKELLYFCNFIPLNSLLVHHSVFDTIGLFNEDFPVYEDWDFLLRVSEYYDLYYLPELVSEYRNFGDSTFSGNRFSNDQTAGIQDRIWLRFWSKITFDSLRKYTNFLVQLNVYGLHVSYQELNHDLQKSLEVKSELEMEVTKKNTLLEEQERLITSLTEDNANLEKHFSSDNFWVKERERHIEFLTEANANLEQELKTKNNLLEEQERHISSLTKANVNLEEDLNTTSFWLKEREKQIDFLNRTYKLTRNSLSWKITSPLRIMKSLYCSANRYLKNYLYRRIRCLPMTNRMRNYLRRIYYTKCCSQPNNIKSSLHVEKTLVSVIVPVYNHAQYVTCCIESILNQTYDHFELIVVDDASPDTEVKEILRKYEHRKKIKIIYNEYNLGIAEATNRGLFESKGELIAFVDCDDYIAPEAIETVISMWTADTTYAYTDRVYVNTENSEVSRVSFVELPRQDYLQEQLDGKMYTSHLKIVHRRVFEKVGLFDSRFDAAQDYEFLLRVAFHFPSSSFLHVPRFLYYHRWHDEQQTIQAEKKQQQAITKASDLAKKRVAIRKGRFDKLLTFLVPSFGKEDQTLQCVQSIKKTVTVPHEILIWDNGSEQHTIEFLKKHVEPIENVRTFYSEHNYGPALGRLKALQYAKGEYIVSLDNDIELTPGWLEELLVEAEENPDIAAVCCRVTFPNNNLQFSGGYFENNGKRLKLGLYDQGKSVHDLRTLKHRRCDWVPIGATLYKYGLPIDGGFPNVFEDIDVSFTLKRTGKILVNSPNSLAIHNHIMFDSFRGKKEKEYLSFRYHPQKMLQSVKRFYEKYGLIIDDDYVFSVNHLQGKDDDRIIEAFESLDHKGLTREPL